MQLEGMDCFKTGVDPPMSEDHDESTGRVESAEKKLIRSKKSKGATRIRLKRGVTGNSRKEMEMG